MHKKLIIVLLFFCQTIIPSDSASNRVHLARAVFATIGTTAAAFGMHYINKRYEERRGQTSAAPQQTLLAASPVTIAIPRVPFTTIPIEKSYRFVGWEPHKNLLSFLAEGPKDKTWKYQSKLEDFLFRTPEMHSTPGQDLIKDPKTTAYIDDFGLEKFNLILIMHGNTLYKRNAWHRRDEQYGKKLYAEDVPKILSLLKNSDTVKAFYLSFQRGKVVITDLSLFPIIESYL